MLPVVVPERRSADVEEVAVPTGHAAGCVGASGDGASVPAEVVEGLPLMHADAAVEPGHGAAVAPLERVHPPARANADAEDPGGPVSAQRAPDGGDGDDRWDGEGQEQDEDGSIAEMLNSPEWYARCVPRVCSL